MEEFDPSSIGAVAVEAETFDPSSIGAVPIDEDFDPISIGAQPVETEEDTLGDDWSGFVANMKIAGNRLGQGIDIARVEQVSGWKNEADEAKRYVDILESKDPNVDVRDVAPLFGSLGGAQLYSLEKAREKYLQGEESSFYENALKTARNRFEGARKTFEEGAATIPEYVESIAQKEKRIEELSPQLSPEMQQLNRSEGSEFWRTFASNPVESIANVIASSAVVGAPGIALGAIGSIAGPAGTAAGSAYGSFITETSQSMLDSLRESGVDLTNPEKTQAALGDPIIMQKARQIAESRGVAVATFDALTAGLAGRFIGPVLKETAPATFAVVKASGKELAMQMAGGATGELVAQGAAAQEISGKEIALEALGEIGSGVTETISNLRQSGAPLTAQALQTETKGGETDEQNETQRLPDSTGTQQAGDAQREAERGGEILPTPGVQVPESTVQSSGEGSPRTEVPNREELLTTEGEVPPPAPVPTLEPVEVPQQQESPTPQEQKKVLTPDDRATALQPFLKAAQAAAQASGATDPEDAAQVAWIKVSNSEKPLDNPRAVLIDAARSEAKNQLSKANAQKRGGGLVEGMDVADLESQAVQTRGPRAEAVSKEDMEGIAKAIGTLNENERRVAMVRARGEEMTAAEVAEELDLAEGTVRNIDMKLKELLKPYAKTMGFGQSLGPGAASAAEVLTQYEVRRFSERFQKSKDIDEDVKEQTGNRYYEVLPNEVTAQKAREFFEQNPDTERAISLVMDEKQGVSFADRAAIGQLLVKKINEERRALKSTDPEKADRLLDRVIEASEWLAEYGTRLGQGVQAFAMWNRLTPEGKLRSVQKEVKKTRKKYIRDNQKDVDEVHEILNEDTSNEVKRSKLSKSKSRTAKAAKKNLNKIPKKPTKEQLLDTLAKDLGLPELTPEQQAEIMRLAEIAENAPEGMPKQDALNELNSYIARIKGFQWSDLPLGVYYGNILSGVPTQVVNLVDTALNVINESAALAATDPKAAAEIMRGLARGIETGRFDSLLALTKGRRISDGKMVETPFLMDVAEFGKEGGVPIQTTGPISSLAKKAAESKGAKYLNAYKYVGRAMAASDSVLFRSAQEAKAAQLAYRMANTLKGEELRAEVDRILGFDRAQEFLSQAEAEGYTGATARARATELMILSRPEELQKEAADFASEATYNYKPYGFAGAVSNSIETLSRKYPALKLIVPFTRIVANVFNRGINNTPYGAFRAWRGKSGDRTFTESERDMLNARAAIGTAALTTIAALATTGAITLHGQGPPEEEKRKQLRQTGWKPYSIQIGDKYYTYTYTPIGLGLAAYANFLDSAKYKTFSEKDNLTRLAYAMQSVGSTLFSQSFLSGLSSLFEMLSSRPATAMSAAKRFASSTTSGLAVPFASLLKDINQAFDPSVRDADSITEAMISEIPVARTSIKPAINALGEPIMKDRFRLRERFYSKQKEGPWKTVRELGLRVPTTGPFFENPDPDYEYAKKTGERIKGYLERNEEMLRSVPQKVAQDSLENFTDRVKKEVRGSMLYQGAKKKPK